MNKKELTEQEIRTRYITPAILQAGWQAPQIREEYYFTDGRYYLRPNGRARHGEHAGRLVTRSFVEFSGDNVRGVYTSRDRLCPLRRAGAL